ncbi:hypothetical protein PAPYR_11456 [Paratrimastix pyriformis]|uniref:Uncharacterized protein n=1 Tax=Paratrimastix pyriformis TaxID=342808 RepID=A0ABQ8U6K1_9EUKA|nr:hypothetical protein PAPYR_11456 [Paratrimastix pyriformis]
MLGARLSLNVYRQLATGKADSTENSESLAALALMEASFRQYTAEQQQYVSSLQHYNALSEELDIATRSFRWAFNRTELYCPPRMDLTKAAQLNNSEAAPGSPSGHKQVGSRFFTTVDYNPLWMSLLSVPNDAAISAFYDVLASREPVPRPPVPVSFGNVFFASQNINIDIHDNGNVNIGAMTLINMSDSFKTNTRVTPRDIALSDENARYYAGLRKITETQKARYDDISKSSNDIQRAQAKLELMRSTTRLFRELFDLELMYRRLHPDYISHRTAAVENFSRVQRSHAAHITQLDQEATRLDKSLLYDTEALAKMKTSYDGEISRMTDRENTFHYEALTRIAKLYDVAPPSTPDVQPPREHAPEPTPPASGQPQAEESARRRVISGLDNNYVIAAAVAAGGLVLCMIL